MEPEQPDNAPYAANLDLDPDVEVEQIELAGTDALDAQREYRAGPITLRYMPYERDGEAVAAGVDAHIERLDAEHWWLALSAHGLRLAADFESDTPISVAWRYEATPEHVTPEHCPACDQRLFGGRHPIRLPRAEEVTVESVRCDEQRVSFRMRSGVEISVPLTPRLAAGTPQQRAKYEITSDGFGVTWPDLDEDIAPALSAGVSEDLALAALGWRRSVAGPRALEHEPGDPMTRVIAAEATQPGRLRLLLSDGSVVERDVSKLLTGPVFAPLHDWAVFRAVGVEGGTVAWSNGADIAPETLIWNGPPPDAGSVPPAFAVCEPPERA